MDYDINYETILNGIGNYVLIVLNKSLNSKRSNNSTLKKSWHNARKRVLVDGASNWLFDNYGEEFGLPDFITGDLDSISKEAFEFFEKQLPSSNIVKLLDQDKTDFDKTISFCNEKFNDIKLDYFFVTWSQTERIDHNLSCISTLIKNNNRGSVPIYLVDVDNSLSCVIKDLKKIKINKKSEWCSIIPVGEPSKVTTNGFKWNLNDYELKFGELISSSNKFDSESDFCEIKGNKPVFFTMHTPE